MELEAIGKRLRISSGSSSLAGDRLTSLPDCLIHHIMSFLKARQVVQTCVLSTRWRHLWRSVPCLDIDQDEFKAAGSNRITEKERDDFEDFTDHLLIPNNISIALVDTLRLHVSGEYYRRRASARWIRHGIKYSAQNPGIMHKESNLAFWRLKKLHLCGVYLDGSFMKHVGSGCPYLEVLELKDCPCTFKEVTSPTLKSLTIITSGYYNRSTLVFKAPAVAYLLLDVYAYFVKCYVSFDEMSSLAKASIYLRDSVGSGLSKDFKLLCSVSNVTTLVLSGFQTMV